MSALAQLRDEAADGLTLALGSGAAHQVLGTLQHGVAGVVAAIVAYAAVPAVVAPDIVLAAV